MLCVVLHKSGYDEKLLVKLGIMEPTEKIDWSAFSWESCLENLEIDVDVVFFGDSITRGGKFQNYFDDVSICNLGLSGDSVANMKSRVGMIEAVNPEKIFIMAGVNDLLSAKGDAGIIIDNYESLLTEIEKISDAQIYIESILPVNEEMLQDGRKNTDIRKLNIELKKMADKRGYTFIDLYKLYETDGYLPKKFTKEGIHLNDESYKIWYKEIEQYLN